MPTIGCFITPDVDEPVHVVIGTAQYTTLALARAATLPSLGALPSAEEKIIYKMTYQNNGGTPDYIEATDYRTTSNLPSTSYVATDHGALAGLGDDDHPQYRLVTASREKLTANRTYYVRVDGSDSNTGLADTAAGAFLTIQKAWDMVQALDASGYSIYIYVRAGTYTAGLSIVSYPVSPVAVYIYGDETTPSECVYRHGQPVLLHAGSRCHYLLWVPDGLVAATLLRGREPPWSNRQSGGEQVPDRCNLPTSMSEGIRRSGRALHHSRRRRFTRPVPIPRCIDRGMGRHDHLDRDSSVFHGIRLRQQLLLHLDGNHDLHRSGNRVDVQRQCQRCHKLLW